jgi:hypothetical protein
MTGVFFLPLSVSLVVVILDFFERFRYFQPAADTLWQRLLY